MEHNLGRVRPVFRGEYSENENYRDLDIVRYNGSSWVCTATAGTSTAPDPNTGYWQRLTDGFDTLSLDYDYVVDHAAYTETDGIVRSWYRVYRSGWIEAGGMVKAYSNADSVTEKFISYPTHIPVVFGVQADIVYRGLGYVGEPYISSVFPAFGINYATETSISVLVGPRKYDRFGRSYLFSYPDLILSWRVWGR